MAQVVVAVIVVAVALVVGLVLRSGRQVSAPTQPVAVVPVQLDRADFPDATTPWVVVVFSSATCHSCADVVRKAQVLSSKAVTVVDVEFSSNAALHRKYDIQAVPIVAIADHQGVVHRGFAGPVTATDLWAAVADAREPGTSPEPELGQGVD